MRADCSSFPIYAEGISHSPKADIIVKAGVRTFGFDHPNGITKNYVPLRVRGMFPFYTFA